MNKKKWLILIIIFLSDKFLNKRIIIYIPLTQELIRPWIRAIMFEESSISQSCQLSIKEPNNEMDMVPRRLLVHKPIPPWFVPLTTALESGRNLPPSQNLHQTQAPSSVHTHSHALPKTKWHNPPALESGRNLSPIPFTYARAPPPQTKHNKKWDSSGMGWPPFGERVQLWVPWKKLRYSEVCEVIMLPAAKAATLRRHLQRSEINKKWDIRTDMSRGLVVPSLDTCEAFLVAEKERHGGRAGSHRTALPIRRPTRGLGEAVIVDPVTSRGPGYPNDYFVLTASLHLFFHRGTEVGLCQSIWKRERV